MGNGMKGTKRTFEEEQREKEAYSEGEEEERSL